MFVQSVEFYYIASSCRHFISSSHIQRGVIVVADKYRNTYIFILLIKAKKESSQTPLNNLNTLSSVLVTLHKREMFHLKSYHETT